MPDETPGVSNNAPDTSNQTPDFVTKDQIAGVVNAAVTNHLKRLETKHKADLESALKPILDKLTAPPTEVEDSGRKKQVDPELAALRQQIDDFKRQAQESEERRIATERRAREDRAYSDFRGELGKHVKPEVLDVIASYLFKIQGAVEVPDEGEPVYKSTRNNFGVDEEVRLPMKDGIAAWAKSEAAKAWLPAPSTSQSPPVKKPSSAGQRLPDSFNLENATDQQKLRAADELEAQIKQALAAAGKSL